MGRVIKTKVKGYFLVLMVAKSNQSLRFQGNPVQDDLLWCFLIVNRKYIGKCFGRFEKHRCIITHFSFGLIVHVNQKIELSYKVNLIVIKRFYNQLILCQARAHDDQTLQQHL